MRVAFQESALPMVTDQQIRRLYKLSNTEETKEIAASKAGMDVKTARKYLRARRLPSEMKAERHWRTRQDGFAEVWPEIWAQLKTNPGLEAKTIFAALQRQYPERFADGRLRTLQRRIKQWRATEGPAQEVYFVQEHRPGSYGRATKHGGAGVGASIAAKSFVVALFVSVCCRYGSAQTAQVLPEIDVYLEPFQYTRRLTCLR